MHSLIRLRLHYDISRFSDVTMWGMQKLSNILNIIINKKELIWRAVSEDPLNFVRQGHTLPESYTSSRKAYLS